MEEPTRKSFLDIVKNDLNSTGRYSLTTRFAYIGEYEGPASESLKIFQNNIQDLKEEYGEDISGLLLMYPKHFLHLIEAPEESIYKHLSAVMLSAGGTLLGHTLALPAYSNVLQAPLPGWFSAQIDSPPLLLDKIEKRELSLVQKHVQNCLLKMYSLWQVLADSTADEAQGPEEATKNLDTAVPHLLPEHTVVEYLLSIDSKALPDLREYLLSFERVPLINLFNDRVWPPPRDFVPRNLVVDLKNKPKRA